MDDNIALRDMPEIRSRVGQIEADIRKELIQYLNKKRYNVVACQWRVIYTKDGFNLTFGDAMSIKTYQIKRSVVKKWIRHCIEHKRFIDVVAFAKGIRAEHLISHPIEENISESVNERITPRVLQAIVDEGMYRMYILDNVVHIEGVYNYRFDCVEGMQIKNSSNFIVTVDKNLPGRREKFKLSSENMDRSEREGAKQLGAFEHTVEQMNNTNILVTHDLPDNIEFRDGSIGGVKYNYDVTALFLRYKGGEYRELKPNSGLTV